METYSSKRLAKNTLMMYFRMGVTIIVGFISTRVLFKVLGVEDYGLYGAVAGFITMFTFITAALSATTQRYFSFELGKGNDNSLKEVYNATVRLYIIIALIVFILLETLGLWFLNYKMSFPEGKLALANFVYQFSIIIAIVEIARVPFNAAIISNERFDFYAYTSIIEAFLKLGIVGLLLLAPDKASFLYIVLRLIITTIMLLWYVWYGKRHFSYLKLSKTYDKSLSKEIMQFSGWGFFGALCNMGYRQGVNVVINLFFGVILNAAFTIANQVSGFVNQFVAGFQSAYNPQITKTCASGTSDEQTKLVVFTSKISFSLILIISCCIIANMDFLLRLWLGNIPEKAVSLCSLMIIAAVVDSFTDPFWIVIYTTGKIKAYQLWCAMLMIANVGATILIFYLGFSVEASMYVRIAMNIGIIIVRLKIANKQSQVSVKTFMKDLIPKVLSVSVIALLLMLLIDVVRNEWIKLLAITPVMACVLSVMILLFMFSKEDRKALKKIVTSKIQRKSM